MARLIRTEYVAGLRKILEVPAPDPATIDDLQRWSNIVAEEALRDVAALLEAHPVQAVAKRSTFDAIYIDALAPSVVLDAVHAWRIISEDLREAERMHNFESSTRFGLSVERMKEHARVQLAWADELTTATVNLTKSDLHYYEASLHQLFGDSVAVKLRAQAGDAR